MGDILGEWVTLTDEVTEIELDEIMNCEMNG